MLKLFSHNNQRFLKQSEKSETDLNKFLKENWKHIFPQFTIITNEFKLEGNVRSRGTSGRIDILAFNPKVKKFIVFELKKNQDKNIRDQASDYRDFIEDNFADIYLQATQKYDIQLPKYSEISKESVEVVLMAKQFSQPDIEKAKKSNGEVTLIKYFWFEDDLFLIDYLNNDPDDLLEALNTEKIKKIKAIIENKAESTLSETDIFFHKFDKSKLLFNIFFNFLKELNTVKVQVNQNTVRLFTEKNHTFSVLRFTGKGQKKSLLRIDTDLKIDIVDGLKIEDRMKEDGTSKGSMGVERYQVYISNENQLANFITAIEPFIKL